ncbi:hypothetical protein V8D89_014769 [Ganoderma adspersum]
MFLPTQKKPADDWIKNHMQRMVHQEIDQYAAGTLAVVRSEEAIKMDIMKNPTSTETAKPMPLKLGKLLSHLESCLKVTDTVRNHAKVLQGLRNPRCGKAACGTHGRGNKENTHPALTSWSRTLNIPPPISRGSPTSHSSTSSGHGTIADVEEILANINDESRGFPYSLAVEFPANVPYWCAFFRKWISGALLPSRQAISGRILDSEAKRVVKGMKVHLKNQYSMGQSDGMVNAEYEGHILHAHDISSLLKTAETLLAIVKAEIEFYKHILDLIIVAWCTDGGGDCAKMRQLLQMKYPHLATPHCWAHQVCLMLGSYLKSKTPSFNNYSHALGLLKEQQRARLPGGEGRVLALLRPCETQWTAHVVSAGHFLKLQKPIWGCILDHRKELVACAEKEQAQKEKVEQLLDEIEKPEFWRLVSDAYTHGALAIATNAPHGDHACLDVVLITLGNLYHTYCNTATYGTDTQAVMHKSLEACWKKTGKERELYILTIVLNPMLRTTPFHENNPLLTPQSLWAMFKCNYTCMEQHNSDQELKTAFTEYLTSVGEWLDEEMGLTEVLNFAKQTGELINLITLWCALDTKDLHGRNGLVKFAMRLFSIVPNSAMIERIFSHFRTVHNKLRNRLHLEKVRKVVLVKADIDCVYSNGRQEQCRHFGVHEDPDSDEESATTQDTVAQPLVDSHTHSSSHDTLPQHPQSFTSLAANLITAIDNDDVNSRDEHSPTISRAEPDVVLCTSQSLSPLSITSTLPPPKTASISCTEAMYLRNLFQYPPVGGAATEPALSTRAVSSNPLTTFWTLSKQHLEAEQDEYDREEAEIKQQVAAEVEAVAEAASE